MGGKKSLKKIVCLMMVFMTTAFSLVGCGGNKDDAANDDALKMICDWIQSNPKEFMEKLKK